MTAISAHFTRWTGKALGAAAGLIFAPASATALLWWVLAGIAAGHLLDLSSRRLAAPQRNPRRATNTHDGSDAPAAVRFAFAALGRIGRASGHLGPEHVRLAERLMDRLAFAPPRRREALVWFYAGQDDAFPFDAVAAATRVEFDAHRVLKDLTVDSLCRMCALADSPQATAALLELGSAIGLAREALALRAVAAAALAPQRSALDDARALLGVQPGDSHSLVRLAYRRQVSRWHPDRLPGDASPEDRNLAEQHMWQLREALEMLLAEP